ncbi:MAG: flagellar hook-associated protein 3 [Cupriavidus sp.]|nr:MAG: flagellar hook-associated protein 3 [Cupriavidus sp.]
MLTRISTSVLAQQAVNSMLSQQTAIAATQNQITSGQRMQTAADDPVGWSQAMGLDNLAAGISNYQSNVTMATMQLNQESSTLTSISNLLSSANQLGIEANNPALSKQDRQNVAASLTQIKQQLLGYANTQDSNGNYIFAGSASGSAPFSLSGTTVSYSGDQTSRMIAIGQNRAVAQGDSGSSVFMGALGGNGTFTATANSSNSGTGVLTSTNVSDASQWDGGQYTLSFTAGSYQVTDASNNVVASGSYTAGSSIQFRGVSLTISGTPASGDSFSVGPSQPKDVFSSLQDLIDAVQNPGSTPAQSAQVQTALYNAQMALTNNADRITNVNASVGSRLDTVNAASASLTQQSTDAQQALASIAGTDMAKAASQLSLQTTVLQASQLAFSKVQGLSLFNYIK